MMRQLAVHHLTDCVDEISLVEILESIFIRIVGIGPTIKLMSGGVFDPILITSILGRMSTTCNDGSKGTYTVFFSIKHEGGDGPTLISSSPSLASNTDSSMANAEMVGGARDGVEGRRH